MDSSRIFVKNLPPNITETQFRNHFAAGGRDVTDIRLIPKRRVGFVGYKSSQDAAKAIKYFNKTFIRMSRIAVEAARPIARNHVPPRREEPSKPASSGLIEEAQAKSKKRKREDLDENDPKLREFLGVYGSRKDREGAGDQAPEEDAVRPVEAEESDDEYEAVPSKGATKRGRIIEEAGDVAKEDGSNGNDDERMADAEPQEREAVRLPAAPELPPDATDDDWLRSRTNRVLDLLDDDEDLRPAKQPLKKPSEGVDKQDDVEVEDGEGKATSPSPSLNLEKKAEPGAAPTGPGAGSREDDSIELIRKTARLYVRNLPFAVSEEELREHFERFGDIVEAHIPASTTGTGRGFALITFDDAENAISAFREADGSFFQGRILHVLPGRKSAQMLDEFELSKLPLKKQNLLRKRAQATNSFNWNSLFMSQDAVNSSVAERLGVSKSELLDPTDASAAVTQAIAETQVIQDTKNYFAVNGVNLDAFKSHKRGDTAILVKNFAYGTTSEELRELFEPYGSIMKVLMPPSGTIAIVQYAHATQAKLALSKMAYRKLGGSVLFLEMGPKGLFGDAVAAPEVATRQAGEPVKPTVSDLLVADAQEDADTSSLFVKGLAFSTTATRLGDTFRSLDGFVLAKVNTKPDPKHPGQTLSMGFGFIDFRTPEQALAAQKAIDGYSLDGHVLACKLSNRKQHDQKKKATGQKTKIIIKNLPFEASRKDVRALFSKYGQLRVVRIPKSAGHRSRGFGFAEFVNAREAENAYNALKDTHLLGRRLVLDFAEADALDPEEEIAKMQRKIGGQADKMAMMKLTGGRQKVDLGENDGD